METSLLGLSVPKSLILCTLSSCGSLYLFHLLQVKASLMMAEQALTSKYSRMSLGILAEQLIPDFFFNIWVLKAIILPTELSHRILFKMIFILLFLCICVFCPPVYLCIIGMSSAYGIQKRALDAL